MKLFQQLFLSTNPTNGGNDKRQIDNLQNSKDAHHTLTHT